MRVVMFIALQLLLSAKAGATPAAQLASGRPAIIVLHVADDADAARRERRFTTELQLALDGLEVHTALPSAGFLEQPLAQQIAQVRRLVRERNAVAVTWIGSLDRDVLLLHMVVLSTHRALVRLLEAKVELDVEARLALAARELLGTAYLLTAGAQAELAGVRQAVVGMRRQVASVSSEAVGQGDDWGLLARAHVESPLSGSIGPSLLRGAALAVERRVLGTLWARAGVGAALGPSGELQDGRVDGYELWPAAGLCWWWPAPSARLGLALEAQARFARLSVQVGDGPERQLSQGRIRVQASGELQWFSSRAFALSLQLGLGVVSHRDSFARESSGERFMRRSLLDFSLHVGPRLSL